MSIDLITNFTLESSISTLSKSNEILKIHKRILRSRESLTTLKSISENNEIQPELILIRKKKSNLKIEDKINNKIHDHIDDKNKIKFKDELDREIMIKPILKKHHCQMRSSQLKSFSPSFNRIKKHVRFIDTDFINNENVIKKPLAEIFEFESYTKFKIDITNNNFYKSDLIVNERKQKSKCKCICLFF